MPSKQRLERCQWELRRYVVHAEAVACVGWRAANAWGLGDEFTVPGSSRVLLHAVVLHGWLRITQAAVTDGGASSRQPYDEAHC